MEFLRIDLTAIVAVAYGGLVLLIPIVGLTARLAVPPIVDAIARARAPQGANRALANIEARLARLERRFEDLIVETPRRSEDDAQARSLASLSL